MSRPRSVFSQLVLVIALVLLGAGVLVVMLGREFATRPASDQLLRAIDALADAVETMAAGQSPATMVQLLRDRGLEVREAEPPASSGRAPALRLIERRANRILGEERQVSAGQGVGGNVLWLKLQTPQPLWVAFAHDTGPVTTRRFSVLLLGGCALLVWLAAAYFARRLVQPLRALAGSAPGIARGEEPLLPYVDGPREVMELAGALAQSGREVRAAAEERALMLAGISHDLRTPLTRLQFALELLPGTDPALRAGMTHDIEEIDAILSQFIAYARDGRDEASEMLDLVETCRHALAAMSPQWQFEAPASAPLHGRPMALLRAVENLLVNAQRHGQPPWSLHLFRAADSWRIEVADLGPGLSSEAAAHVRQPFARGSGNAGSGLGLAIVERVARQHGGELQLLANSPRGLRAVLVLRGALDPSSVPAT